MKVSIVSLTYNQKDLTLALAKTMLHHLKQHEFEWVLLDNGDDGTREELVKLWTDHAPDSAHLHIIPGNNEGNFASMNNAAAMKAKGEILCFLNNDTELLSDILAPAIGLLDGHPQVGIVGSVLRYKKNFKLQHSGIFFEKNVTPGELGDYAQGALRMREEWAHPEDWSSPVLFKAVTAACFFMRKTDFKQLRGFDEIFDWCFEDVDLCLRMQYHAKKTVCTHPDIRLLHHGSASGGDRKIKINLEILRGRWKGIVRTDTERFRQMVPEMRRPAPKACTLPEPGPHSPSG